MRRMRRTSDRLAAATACALAASILPQAASAAWTQVLPDARFVSEQPQSTLLDASIAMRGAPWVAIGFGDIAVDRPNPDGTGWQLAGSNAVLSHGYSSHPRIVAALDQTDVVWQN